MTTTPTADSLVQDYLHRLEAATHSLPADRRAELLEEISAHITHARATGDVHDEAGLRQLLDRLGDPSEIAAAAFDQDAGAGAEPGPEHVTGHQRTAHAYRPGIGLEIAAVVMLTIGSIVPVIGWLTGLALAWTSRRWSTTEKLLATLVVPGGPAIAFYVAFFAGGSCASSAPAGSLPSAAAEQAAQACTIPGPPEWLVVALLAVALVGPFIVGGVLLHRAAARAAARSGDEGRRRCDQSLLQPGQVC